MFNSLDFKGIDNLPRSSSLSLGGSFDHMHIMHKILLSAAVLCSNSHIWVGITSDSIVSTKSYALVSQSFQLRKQKVQNFLENFAGSHMTITLFELNDPMGPWHSDWDALLVSQETLRGGHKLNELRRNNNLDELALISLSVLEFSDMKLFADDLCQDSFSLFEGKLSSTQVRKVVVEQAGSDASKVNWVKSLFSESLKNLEIDFDRETLDEFFDVISKKYSETSRYYHTMQHIIDCLAKLQNHFLDLIPSKGDLAVVTIALIYHDVIYNAQREDNELKSAQLARDQLGVLGMQQSRIEQVFELIMATISHKHDLPFQPIGTFSFLKDVLIDIDISILSSGRNVYAKYAREVALEYAFLGRSVYKQRRKQVLGGILQMKNIYRFTNIFSLSALQDNINFEIDNML